MLRYGRPHRRSKLLLWTRWRVLRDPGERARLLDRWAGWGVAGIKVDFLLSDSAGRMAVFADPSGAVFMAWKPNLMIGAELVGEPATLVWNELVTDDIEGSREFYAKALGWQTSSMEFPAVPPVQVGLPTTVASRPAPVASAATMPLVSSNFHRHNRPESCAISPAPNRRL